MHAATTTVQDIQTSLESAFAASRITEIISSSTPNIMSTEGVRSIFSYGSWLPSGIFCNAFMADDASPTCELKMDQYLQSLVRWDTESQSLFDSLSRGYLHFISSWKSSKVFLWVGSACIFLLPQDSISRCLIKELRLRRYVASLIFCRRTSVLRTPVAVPLISKMRPLKARTLAALLMVDDGSAMVSEIIWACTPAMKAAFQIVLQ